MYNLWVELAREVRCHSHASRAGLELFLVQHTVHLTGLAARGGGAGPTVRGEDRTLESCASKFCVCGQGDCAAVIVADSSSFFFLGAYGSCFMQQQIKLAKPLVN